uniref:Protein kinase domain-containing protein n=1 Tax=Timema douglasi TaxID=61478 RepID=A0A7R8Z7D2_TIMDO|nr:unnamed protein product [Timema douglasi]
MIDIRFPKLWKYLGARTGSKTWREKTLDAESHPVLFNYSLVACRGVLRGEQTLFKLYHLGPISPIIHMLCLTWECIPLNTSPVSLTEGCEQHTAIMRGDKKESSIHRIQEVALEDVEMSRDYDVIKTLGEGCFAKVLLATHRRTSTTIVLKAIHTELTGVKDFYREFHYSYHLSPHPNILSVYSVVFKADDCFVFAQEYAPLGDLAGNVRAGGLPEQACKNIAQQLASALEFLHSKDLVHRDLKLENILVFAADMSKVKLCDFGSTRRDGSLVTKTKCTWHPFIPPEVCEVVSNERYHCRTTADCWQLGIIIFVCLTGCPPWQSADSISDPAYCGFLRWQKRRTTKIPPQFRRFSSRLLRMFRRLLEHKADKRSSVSEVNKYLKDAWMERKSPAATAVGGGTSSSAAAVSGDKRDYLNMYLDHGDEHNQLSDESKSKLKRLLNSYGLETTVDQKVMTKRVWEWLMTCETELESTLEGI